MFERKFIFLVILEMIRKIGLKSMSGPVSYLNFGIFRKNLARNTNYYLCIPMNTISFRCSLCSCEYNQDNHILPKSLLCGHTICSKCLSSIISNESSPRCPFDRTPLKHGNETDFPTNVLILQLLEEQRQTNTEFCSLHQEPNLFIRMTDKVKVCSYCYYLDHDVQKIVHIKEIQKQADEKAKRLQEIEEKVTSYQERIQAELNERRDSLIDIISTSYKKIHEELYQKEEKVKSEVMLFFAHQLQSVEQKISQGCPKVSKIHKLIKNLTAGDFTDRFFKTFNMELDVGSINNLEKTLNDMQVSFDNTHFALLEDNNDKALRMITDFVELQNASGEVKISPKLIPSQRSLSSQDISEIKEFLKEAKSIRLINSQLDSSKEFFANFYSVWQHTKAVTSLSLEFPYSTKLSSETVSVLHSYKHWNLDKIADFTLDLRLSEDVSITALLTLFEELVKKMKNLTKMEIILTRLRIRGSNVLIRSALDGIFNPIQEKLKSIRTFSLQLEDCRMQDQNVRELGESIANSMPDLKSLKLNLDGNEITDFGMVQFVQKLKDASKDIEYLEISLSTMRITRRTLEAFIKELLPALNNLRLLVLNLEQTNIQKDEVMKLVVELKSYVRAEYDFQIKIGGSQISKRSFGDSLLTEEEKEGENQRKVESQEKKKKQRAKNMQSDFFIFGNRDRKVMDGSELGRFDKEVKAERKKLPLRQIKSNRALSEVNIFKKDGFNR